MAVKQIPNHILRQYLKENIIKNGQMTVPRWDIKGYFPKPKMSFKGLTLRGMEREERDFVKQFMINYFYKEAPVPEAIGLHDTLKKHDFLHQEIDMMVDSEVCTVTEDPASKQVVGATINTAWGVDYKYEYFDVDPLAWMNIAAEIAEQECNDDPTLATVIWRDYHFQLIYHIVQGIAQQRKPKYILYSGMGYTLQEFRMTGVTPYMIDKFADWLKSQNCQYSFMGTFPKFADIMRQYLGGKLDIVANIQYKDLKFDPRKSGQNVFQPLADKDGMVLMTSSKS